MPANTGRNFKLKDGLLTGDTVIAAMRTTGFSINGETVDVTTKDSTNNARELLAGAGITSMSINAAGLLSASTQATTLIGRVKSMSLNPYRIEFDNGDSITGQFQITSFEATGEYNGAQTYSMTLESGADFTVTAVP